ncbi:choice-of-anchor M domain-containing protein [Solirubrobacter deserti]|uniref:Choice-of-anchor M domain-containing protein n=1 Tax=Solirubrobacter deserti TaxID=2282478 RepID=A0ABT4RP55_9ACTN|nr:choice-of-anchor M domain-containing protein [Solirubrobacter deserti]MDA0140347.1 choice-of-anchor M domain-containing protein [Solirubrobacter deserti]
MRVLLGVLLALVAPAVASAAPPVVLDAGHADIGPFWVGEELRMQVKAGDVSHEFDDVVIRIGPEGRIRVPASGSAGKEWEYVGNRGAWVWRLPEDASHNLLWAGFGNSPTQDLLRPFNMTLDGVSGPGEVVLWAMGADMPFWSTRQGLPMARTSTGHFHMAWYVTEPGVYCLNMGASARRAAGRATAQAQLTIVTATDAAGAPIDASTIVPCGRRGSEAPVASPTAVPAAAAGGPAHVVTSDRYELRPRLDGDALAVDLAQFSGRDPGSTRRPEDVVFYQRAPRLPPTAPWQSPSGGDVAQLRPGTSGPQLGWSTTRIADGDLQWRLVNVDGPGTVTIDDAVSRTHEQRPVLGGGQNTYTLWPGSTSEGTWSFSAPGVYCVGLEWRTDNGASVQHKLTFAIDTPPGTPATIDPATVKPCARPAGEPARRVLSTGHVDLSARVLEGRLEVSIGDDTAGARTYRAPGSVTLAARAAARRAVPADAGFAFLGAAGDPVWVLPQTQDPDLLWPGWSTERIPAGTLQGPLRWTLRAARGPGHVALWQNADLEGAPRVVFNTRDGVPDAADVPLGIHAHGNWAFSREGVYCLDVTMSGTYRSGRVLTAEATVLVAVGAIDAAAASERDCTPGVDPVPDQDPPPGSDPPVDQAPPPATIVPAPPPAPAPAVTPVPRPSAPKLTIAKRVRLNTKTIRVDCQLAAAGRCTVTATLSRATARRLGLRTLTIGRGSASRSAAGTHTVTVRLSTKARKALSRSKRSVAVTLTASTGGASTTKTVVLRR